jgi:hypothetical protein
MIYISGGTEWDEVRFYHATQTSRQFKSYELLISEIIHVIFLEYG